MYFSVNSRLFNCIILLTLLYSVCVCILCMYVCSRRLFPIRLGLDPLHHFTFPQPQVAAGFLHAVMVFGTAYYFFSVTSPPSISVPPCQIRFLQLSLREALISLTVLSACHHPFSPQLFLSIISVISSLLTASPFCSALHPFPKSTRLRASQAQLICMYYVMCVGCWILDPQYNSYFSSGPGVSPCRLNIFLFSEADMHQARGMRV